VVDVNKNQSFQEILLTNSFQTIFLNKRRARYYFSFHCNFHINQMKKQYDSFYFPSKNTIVFIFLHFSSIYFVLYQPQGDNPQGQGSHDPTDPLYHFEKVIQTP